VNIFYLDHEPVKAAQYHVDKHVVKMILETAQLLSNAHWLNGLEGFYRKTHLKHPCSILVANSYYAYKWALDLGLALHDEYQYRYGEHKTHKSIECLKWASKSKITLPRIELPQSLAMPDKYRFSCPVMSYRTYYINDKRHIAKWTRRGTPYWWK
jgi:hypothetical protein